MLRFSKNMSMCSKKLSRFSKKTNFSLRARLPHFQISPNNKKTQISLTTPLRDRSRKDDSESCGMDSIGIKYDRFVAEEWKLSPFVCWRIGLWASSGLKPKRERMRIVCQGVPYLGGGANHPVVGDLLGGGLPPPCTPRLFLFGHHPVNKVPNISSVIILLIKSQISHRSSSFLIKSQISHRSS